MPELDGFITPMGWIFRFKMDDLNIFAYFFNDINILFEFVIRCTGKLYNLQIVLRSYK